LISVQGCVTSKEKGLFPLIEHAKEAAGRGVAGGHRFEIEIREKSVRLRNVDLCFEIFKIERLHGLRWEAER
jgi:hypothetical protein